LKLNLFQITQRLILVCYKLQLLLVVVSLVSTHHNVNKQDICLTISCLVEISMFYTCDLGFSKKILK